MSVLKSVRASLTSHGGYFTGVVVALPGFDATFLLMGVHEKTKCGDENNMINFVAGNSGPEIRISVSTDI